MTPNPFSFYDTESAAYFLNLGFWHGVNSAAPTTVATSIYPQVSNLPFRYNQLAPRIGLAYHLNRPNLVIRAAAGVFYDAAVGSLVSNENPLNV
jgi:phosphoglycerol transferase MdoB-like AlkP superfamily enzyme